MPLSGVKRRRSSSAAPSRSASGYGSGRKSLKLQRGIAAARAGTAAPVFSETYAFPSVLPNTGGVWTGRMADIPQVANYSALYRTFRILKFETIVMPTANVNTSYVAPAGTVSTPVSIPRLTWSVDPSNEVATPTSELNVLDDDGCHISLVDKALRLSCRPKPSVLMSIPANVIGVDLGKSNWFSFDDGTQIVHNGFPYWYTVDTPGGTSPALFPPLKVYHKITFQCRDPR